MIAIVNYGLGNIQAFVNIYKRLNIPFLVAQSETELAQADKIILPGVGSFDWAMRRLDESGLRPYLNELILNKRRPILGICVGMQMMARRSDEGSLLGLGWINADVKSFSESSVNYKVQLPHMGWNDVSPVETYSLFNGMETPKFYFLHSYCIIPDSQDTVLASTEYSGSFASAVKEGHIFGVQFHPEKSHHWGVQLLKNFADL